MAVAARQAPDQLGDVLGGLRLVLRRVAHPHPGHAGDLGRGLGRGAAAGTRHQHMDVAAQLAGRGHGVERGRLDRLVVVFSDNENGHVQITFATFLSLLTSWATSATRSPALRLGGSTTLSVARRGATSTPRSAGLTVSSGFFFAFMMLGSVA